MLRKARFRVAYLLALTSVLLAFLEVRLFRLQVLAATPPAAHAPYRLREVPTTGLRGDVLDRRGRVLARSTEALDVYAWTRDLRARPESWQACLEVLPYRLQVLLGVEPAEVIRDLQEKDWCPLAAGIQDEQTIQELRALAREEHGAILRFAASRVRVYPQGDLFAPFLGCVSDEGFGVAGVEAACDALLQPEPGRKVLRRDAAQRDMVEPDLPREEALAGRSVVLTIEPLIQDRAERAMDDLREEFHARSAQAVVLDPLNGDLLALAQSPRPAAGRPDPERPLEDYRLLPIQEVYPPGSTMKPLMLALVMERTGLDLTRLIDCQHGNAWFGRRHVTDVHGGYGLLTPGEILVHSSNIGMATLLTEMVPADTPRGDPRFQPFLDWLALLGFGQKALGLAGEAAGLTTALPDFSRNYTLTSLSYGYEIGVTPVQMAAAVSCFANGGFRITPRLVRALRDPDGQEVELEPGFRRVMSRATAATIKGWLGQVVEEGGTRDCRPAGYSMGGKTGTAEKEQDRSKLQPSFFCFGPLPDPRLLVLVMVDEPDHFRFAASIVAPTAGRLYGEALELLNIPPDRPEERAEVAARDEGGRGR